MKENQLEKIIPGILQLNWDIDEAYRGIRFMENHGSKEELNHWEQKHQELLRKKDQIVKPIFGL